MRRAHTMGGLGNYAHATQRQVMSDQKAARARRDRKNARRRTTFHGQALAEKHTDRVEQALPQSYQKLKKTKSEMFGLRRSLRTAFHRSLEAEVEKEVKHFLDAGLVPTVCVNGCRRYNEGRNVRPDTRLLKMTKSMLSIDDPLEEEEAKFASLRSPTNISRHEKQLALACSRGHVKMVERLLKESDCNANSVNEAGLSCLALASEHGHVKVAKLLLRSGADLSIVDQNGNTSLHFACMHGYSDVVELFLLTSRNEVNLQNRQGWSPLMFAVVKGNVRCLSLLLESGARSNLTSNTGQSALDIAKDQATKHGPRSYSWTIYQWLLDVTPQEDDLDVPESELVRIDIGL